MNRYVALFSTRTSIQSEPPQLVYQVKFDDAKVSFRQITDERDKTVTELSHGWMIVVELSEDDIVKATNVSHNLTEFFLSVLSLNTGCEVYRSRINLIYDVTEGVDKREFRQYYREIPLPAPPVNFPLFFEQSHKIWNIMHSQHRYKRRIGRAIRWFRKGINEDDSIDQFMFFWHGLEALNSALAQVYNCEKNISKSIERKCKVCGETYTDEITSLGGIEALYDKAGMDGKTQKKIKTVRNGISHGFENIPKLLDECTDLAPILARLLLFAIAEVVDLRFPKLTFLNIGRVVAPIKLGDFLFIEADLNERDVSKVGIDNYYPYLVHEFSESDVSGQFQSRFKPYTGCSYTMHAINVAGKNIQINIEEIMTKPSIDTLETDG